jgi:hypothetical protein
MAPGLEGAFASGTTGGFCRKVEELLRRTDGFQESNVANRIAQKISAAGLMSLGPAGKELSADVLKAVQLDATARELYDDYPGGFRLLEFGSSASLFAVESIAGTAACQTLWFFRRSAAGITRVAGPGQAIGGCAGDFAQMGLVAGEPAIVTETYEAATTKLRFLAWRRGNWGPLCSVSMTYQVRFDVTQGQCSGPDCAEFRKRAPVWAEAARGEKAGESLPLEAGLAPVAGVSEKELNAQNIQTGLTAQPNERAPSFTWNSPLYNVELGGKPYRIRVGELDLGSVGSSPDEYLVTVFEGGDFSRPPVAGYVLQGRRAALNSLDAE